MKDKNVKTDFFEDIAASFNTARKNQLFPNEPMKFEKAVCSIERRCDNPIIAPEVMDTHKELKKALSDMRERYAKFLLDFAPTIQNHYEITEIKDFILDGNEKITLPHYGGPVGNAVKIYETEFCFDGTAPDKAVYICFGGADYEAIVYINDRCVGSHEGFFSPFEFEITDFVKQGKNTLKIELKNDFPYLGFNNKDGVRTFGDKLYAATGLGWDDPELGWHHCPPGMGIYDYVRVEVRNRINIADLFVRPLLEDKKAEVWVTVENADYTEKPINISLSIYGQNFQKEVIKDYVFDPYYCHEKETVVNGETPSCFRLTAAHGSNIYKIMVDIDDVKVWELESPYLYQAQVSVIHDGVICDMKKQQFGMRSFVQDTESIPKGKFYLNGKNIKLRGANTMGFEQQDVLNGDFEQLIDDILLAKICNMNFLRITQRPVQDEVYEYCDKLGLMTQSDLPLFDCMRRTKFAEAVRQTEEMAKIIRKHPCNVVASFINEPVHCAWFRPHRNLLRHELEDMMDCCTKILHLNHPDCVVKRVDGDYDAPTRDSISDIHCYTMWYNGHVIDFGKLYRGYWVDTDNSWCTGCGEFGAEGLESVDLMKRRYPSEWLKEPFSPANIVNAQSIKSHGNFYDTPKTPEDWVEASQIYQAFVAKTMTESFRRNPDMITYAIHLFIDAWPSGWMKSIMDSERTPKKAYFAYRNACAPILITLRSDRFTYYEGEKISIETYVSNDIDEAFKKHTVVYELWKGNVPYKTENFKTNIKACDVTYVSNAEFVIDTVDNREKFTLKAYLLDESGNVVSQNEFPFEVFEDVEVCQNDNIVFIDNLTAGTHTIAGEEVTAYGMKKLHFVSRDSGHSTVAQFKKDDFKYWYNKEEDRITPIADMIFEAKGFTPILVSNNSAFLDENGYPVKHYVVAEKMYEGKRYILSTIDLREENPIAKRFKKAIFSSEVETNETNRL